MNEQVLDPSERDAERKARESAFQPTDPASSREPVPTVHDPGMDRSQEGAPTEPMQPPVPALETAAEPALDTEISDDPLGKTLTQAGYDETLPVDAMTEGVDSAARDRVSAFTANDRFQPIRPHARGGIGLVWVARDCELQRDVALKVIQPRFAGRADQRSRFVLEAEITGKLEHPGIVPVYSLGHSKEGRPYYAMRFIRGESLSAAIKRFHEARKQATESPGKHEPWTWGVEFRQLLGSFLDVCDTIEYAHSRGVLHRDLKPANILIGPYGETLVVDWGLAKVIGKSDLGSVQADGEVESSLAQETTLTPGDTQQGMAIGTPSYMSPEQASGLIDQLGPASDVYSLGATLYELLTGQVAFPGEKVLEILDKVRKGDFPPPRSVCRSLPAPLDAICRKAMAQKPEDRYDSVRALARDIEHWLADEPVTAYPEGKVERLGRWFRRHRTWAFACIATLVGICLVATVAAAVIESSRQREADARREAETNFRMAQDAVDDYLTNVSENILLKEQDSVDIRNLRQELLQSALRYYQNFVSQRGQDRRLRQELANAYFRLGGITKEIASAQEAIKLLRSAQSIWERLAADAPRNDDLKGRVADCQLAIGKLDERIGDLPNALRSLAHAQAILEPLVARHSEVAPLQSNLAECLVKIGVIRANLESTDEALALLQRAKAIRQQMVERSPGDITCRRGLAEVINDLGYVYFKSNDFPAALQAFQEVQEICESLLKEIPVGPKPVKILEWLARSYYNMAAIQERQNQEEQALRSAERSLYYRSALVAAHPSVTVYSADLGMSYLEVALRQHAARQDDKAIPSVQHAIDVFERLAQLHPDVTRYRSELGRSLSTLGFFLDERRENARALPVYQRAVAEEERAIAASEDVNEYKVMLSRDLENLGEQFVDLGRFDEGLKEYRRALEIRTQLHLKHPKSREYTLSLVQTLSFIGAIERQAGRAGAARESLSQARELLEQLAAANAADAAVSGQLGAALTAEAVALTEEQKPQAALPLLVRAIDILKPLGGTGRAGQDDRGRLSEALWQLARVNRSLGRLAEAARLDAERLALWKGRPAEDLADLALKEAGRATLIGYGKTPVPEPAGSIRDHDLELAVADLRLAIAQGYRNLPALRSKPDSSVLLKRDELKSLIRNLEAADRPAKPQTKN